MRLWTSRGVAFLDLYSGAAGVARFLAEKYDSWVLTFDYEDGAEQNLLEPRLQDQICTMIQADCFLCVGAALECCSFSRAVTPAVRSADRPLGLDDISENMQQKVEIGNRHAAFVIRVLLLAVHKGLIYWVENPDGSFVWLHPGFQKAGIGRMENSYRFDMCRFGTPWRKRTRVATNCGLAGLGELCAGDHSHLTLRGRSTAHRCCWTKVAQVYPSAFCRRLGRALAKSVGLVAKHRSALPLTSAMARCEHGRIGEASHPGPAVAPRAPRDPNELLRVALHDAGTLVIQERVWRNFAVWLRDNLSEDTISQLFFSPTLAVWVLQQYGTHLYGAGGRLYELRHLLVLVQQKYPRLKAEMGPAWELVTRWEELHPVKHRDPLPDVLFRAMFSLALLWQWKRMAATLLLGMEGIARIGELLAAKRGDLCLPCDSFDASSLVAFMKVKRPKTMRRGLGRVQHLRIENAEAVMFLQKVLGTLDASLSICPLSSSAFRKRWNKLLDALQVPHRLRPTPGGIRGGGAVLAYKRGEAIQNILWRMRITSQRTLESYLQETAADSLLVKLPTCAKQRIQSFSSLYTLLLSHCS